MLILKSIKLRKEGTQALRRCVGRWVVHEFVLEWHNMFSLLVPWRDLSNTLNSSQKSINSEHVCLRCRTQKELEFCFCEFVATFKLLILYKAKKASLFIVLISGWTMGMVTGWSARKEKLGSRPQEHSPPESTLRTTMQHWYLFKQQLLYLEIHFQFRIINDKRAESDLSVRKNKYDSLPYCCFSTLI